MEHVITSIIAESDFTASGSSNSITAPVVLKNLDPGTSAGTSIQFKAANSTGTEYLAGELIQEHVNKTAGAQDSNIRLRSMQNGTLRDRMYINDVGVAFGVETAVTTIPTNKRFLVTDIPAPTFVSVANGVGVAFNGGGGIYMKNNTDNVEGKFESFSGMIHLGVSGTVVAPVSFWTEGSTERARFLTNGNFLINRITDFNGGYKQQVEGSLWVRDLSFQQTDFDDFNRSSIAANSSPMAWVASTANGGSTTIDTATPTDSSYVGRVIVSTGTTNNNSGRALLVAYNGANKIIPTCGNGVQLIVLEFRVRFPVLSVGGTEFVSLIGFLDGVSAGDPTNGIFFRYTHNVNSGRFQIINRSANTPTTLDSGITVVENTWYKLKIEITSNNEVTFFIDNVNVGSTSTNKPTVACKPSVKIEKQTTNTTTARIVDLDYCILKTER
jgi:hypothetical protein